MKPRNIIGVVVLLGVLLAGCDGRTYYTLGPELTNISQTNESVHIEGKVVLSGAFNDLLIDDVIIEICHNGSVTKTVNIGTLNDNRRSANFSVRTANRPDEIYIRGRVIPDDHEGTVIHLEWNSENDIYAEVTTSKPKSCNPEQRGDTSSTVT